MKFNITPDLIIKLCIFSLSALFIFVVNIFISLKRKKAYFSNILWMRDQFLIWITAIWLFGCLPISLALLFWLVLFFFFKHSLLKEDIKNIYFLVTIQSENDIVYESFSECIKTIFTKEKTNIQLSTNEFKATFSISEYSNTLVLVAIYYLTGIVELYPDLGISYAIGFYLVALSIFVLISRIVYAILNQRGNFFEKGVFSYLFIVVLGIVYFTVLTLFIKNLGYLTL